MAVFKRGKWCWMDAVVNGHRYWEPLGTTDSRKAPTLERERIAQLKDKAPDPTSRSKAIASMSIAEAVKAYITERSAQVGRILA